MVVVVCGGVVVVIGCSPPNFCALWRAPAGPPRSLKVMARTRAKAMAIARIRAWTKARTRAKARAMVRARVRDRARWRDMARARALSNEDSLTSLGLLEMHTCSNHRGLVKQCLGRRLELVRGFAFLGGPIRDSSEGR